VEVSLTTRYRRRGGDLAPDSELWSALGAEAGLRRLLEDFYARVYADPLLAPFFRFTTRSRAVDKQFSFLMEILTGTECYFGDRPYNAHHWMVISDALFEHREALMAECLRSHGVAEHLVSRFRRIDETFRKQIVKRAAKPRKLRGEALPLEGLGDVEIAMGTLCDGCHGEIAAGARARYHLRTGQTYCAACAAPQHEEIA
jgi:truncated hemoglobin YjbI